MVDTTDSHQLTERYDLFLAAGLRQSGCSERNDGITKLVESLGLTIFSPARDGIKGQEATSVAIVVQNRRAIEASEAVLFVADGAGAGVYYELGIADALRKTILGYSAVGVNGLGKAIEGRWQLIPVAMRASSLDSLESVLRSMRFDGSDKRAPRYA